MNTTWGKMMSSVSRNTNEETPLQSRLNKLTSDIGKLGLAIAFFVLCWFGTSLGIRKMIMVQENLTEAEQV